VGSGLLDGALNKLAGLASKRAQSLATKYGEKVAEHVINKTADKADAFLQKKLA
jgi:hypothetical protein